MKPLSIQVNRNFVGRAFELNKLHQISSTKESNIIVVYGRRRIGKTELLEQGFRNRNLLKFEGIEGLSGKAQLSHVMNQLADYTEDRCLLSFTIDTWRDFFKLLAKYTNNGKWTIYFEELQWLANYKGTFISELKYVWDNYFRHNPDLLLILCGSSPSFMLEQVVHSRALYNRSQYEINLRELNLIEAKEFLKNRSNREVLDAYLTVGGVPEYLQWVHKASSVFLSLCEHSFTADSFFSREYEKIFTSSMAKNQFYKKIIEILSQQKFASRKKLMQTLNITSGGMLTNLLSDLEKSGFICKYHPVHLHVNTILTRYAIADNYLQFYFNFIRPLQNNIDNGMYNQNPTMAIKTDNYMKWLGFAFERFCRKYAHVIAKILGFSGVHYQSGVFFNRSTERENPGYQLDLVFDRADNVCTLCEIKYLKSRVSTKVIGEFEKKLSLFQYKAKKTIHKVLICNQGAEQALVNEGYFDQIITEDEWFAPHYW